MSTATFRVSTDILRRLGEELISSFDQGIVELIKNSYDADALKCTVELKDSDSPGGTVVVTDDGYGMSSDDIRDGWLILGRSRKVARERTPRNRLPAGSKGLGRLGALRMGEEVLLVTRPYDEKGTEYSIHIRWDDFDQSNVIEDVTLDIQRSDSTLGPGTHVEIRGLHTSITSREVERLAREMILLSDPFGDPAGFTPELVAPEFNELEEIVSRAYFDDCEYRLLASLGPGGVASAQVFDRSGAVRWASGKSELPGCYRTPLATFELWVFLLQGSSFASRSSTVGEVRKWLRQVGGVHLYHRGLRVRPYGDDGHDWLDMNLARARDPEFRPSTNTSLGRVTVVDEGEELLQKTDRTGFVENEAFRELRRFSIDALEWMHDKRLAEREKGRVEKKRKTDQRTERAGAELKRVIQNLPLGDRQVMEDAARELEFARASEREQIGEELGLYKTLASVGTTVSVFAHEIDGPATDLTVSVGAVERRARKALGEWYEVQVGQPIEAVKQSSSLLARFATLPLHLLRRNKRRRTTVEVNGTVEATVELFQPYLQDTQVETVCEFAEVNPLVRGSVAAIEAIVSNLITNSVKAFKRQGARLGDRTLVLRTTTVADHVLICVLDSGPGIDIMLFDRIWLPGVTSDEDGTGLGLTIVRDTAMELGGRVDAVAEGELGGAEFIIELPIAGVQQ